MRTTADVSRAVARTLERVGLNPDETLTVETGYVSYRFTTRVKGVDPELAAAALTSYTVQLGRRFIDLRRQEDSLLLTQWDR